MRQKKLPKCEMCGEEFIRRSALQRFCGEKSNKKSCSYKNYLAYTLAYTKKWRKTKIGSESRRKTNELYWHKQFLKRSGA